MFTFNINLKITNPCFKKNIFKSFFSFEKTICKNKSFELEVYYHNYDLLGFTIDLSFTGSDHAGPKLEICFLGLTAEITIYDHRHWNYENDTWEEYSELNC